MPSIERIRDHWDVVRPFLLSLIEETGQDLLAEDIFHWCEAGKAHFVLAPEGFVITSVETDAVTGERELLIWFARAFTIGHDCVEKYGAFFQDLAKQLGCRYILTKTAFNPVGDHLVGRGWERGQTEYRLRVT